MFFKKEKLPVNVRLDLCSMCNLNCCDCYMRKYNSCAIGSGYVKLENFISFLDKNPFVKTLEISNNGEVFLNPHLLDMLRIAYERGVQIYCNSVNFNKVSDEVLEGFVKYDVKMLTVAIDGACQETYVKYRRGGNFDTVINN
ncbi:MAG: radical SAM protein, partial [Alphaproteobacteria bacterium]